MNDKFTWYGLSEDGTQRRKESCELGNIRNSWCKKALVAIEETGEQVATFTGENAVSYAQSHALILNEKHAAEIAEYKAKLGVNNMLFDFLNNIHERIKALEKAAKAVQS